MEWIQNCCLLLLGLIAVTELTGHLVRRLCSPGKGQKMMLVIPMTGHNEEAELILRSAVQRVKWMEGRDETPVLCLDYGMDEETRKICEAICREESTVRILLPEEWNSYMELQREKK